MKYFDIIKYKNIWFSISLLFLIPGIIAISLGWLKPGLDFVGGTLIELDFKKSVSVDKVRSSMMKVDKELFKDAKIQPSEEGILSIKSKAINNKQQSALLSNIRSDVSDFEIRKIDVVGPTIGKEIFINSMVGFLLVFGGIVIYISLRFKYDYAVCAIIALVHDVLFLVGSFAIMGKFLGKEVDSLFVTACLTVAAFSINDTIVVYDRIRENLKRSKRGTSIAEAANDGLNQTMTRSINTSVTTLVTLTFLFLWGGDTTKDAVLAMILGVIAGTYSSIFIASPLLVTWRSLAEKSKNNNKPEQQTA